MESQAWIGGRVMHVLYQHPKADHLTMVYWHHLRNKTDIFLSWLMALYYGICEGMWRISTEPWQTMIGLRLLLKSFPNYWSTQNPEGQIHMWKTASGFPAWNVLRHIFIWIVLKKVLSVCIPRYIMTMSAAVLSGTVWFVANGAVWQNQVRVYLWFTQS